MQERLTRWTLRRGRWVLWSWLLVAGFGVWAGFGLNDRLTAVTDVPGSASAAAQAAVRSAFGAETDGSFLVIYEFTQASETEVAGFKRAVEAAAMRIPTAAVQQQRAVGGVLYASIGTALPLLQASAETDELRSALADVGLGTAMVTGPPALEHDVRPVLGDDLRRGGLLGLLLAVGVLVVAFGRSRRIVIPLAVAAGTVSGSLCAVYLLSYFVPMVLYVPSIVELVGLGLAIDYSLLLTYRHQRMSSSSDAIVETMRTAGRTVWWAGATAAIGLASLTLVPIPLVRSLGLAGLVVPLVALSAAHTLVPPLLQRLGAGPARGALAFGAPQVWTRISGWATRRPRASLVASMLVCVVAALPLASVHLAPASLTSLPTEAPAAQALAFVSKRVGPGVVTPLEVLITVQPGAARGTGNDAARRALAEHLTKLPDVFGVFTDDGPNYIDGSASHQRIFVIGRHEFADDSSRRLVETLRALQPKQFGYGAGTTIAIAGAPAQGVDFLDTLGRVMPWVILLIVFAAALVLSKVFGAWRTAVVSVLLNAVSLTAACGLVVAVFQLGLGSNLLRTPQVPQIESWTFVFMFALLFGITTDYQVFIVRSIMEVRGAVADDVMEIQQGVANSAGIVTAGAVAFVAALSGLLLGRIAGLQELGFGLAAGVLIDATVVRGVMLPSALTLLRRR